MEDSLELAIFRGDDFEGAVECRCLSCGYVREVSLTSEQTLRLSLEHA
jgi:hypothetical protein